MSSRSKHLIDTRTGTVHQIPDLIVILRVVLLWELSVSTTTMLWMSMPMVMLSLQSINVRYIRQYDIPLIDHHA